MGFGVQDRGPAEQQAVLQRLLRSDRKRKEKLKAAGIDYDFEGLVRCVPNEKQGNHFNVKSLVWRSRNAKQWMGGGGGGEHGIAMVQILMDFWSFW